MKLSFFDKLTVSTENIRYLLWSTPKLQRTEWVKQLVAWLRIQDTEHAYALLAGLEQISSEESRLLLYAFEDQYTEDDLQYQRLVTRSSVDILLENIRFLTDEALDKKQKEFAHEIGAGQVTVSRWRSGEQQPNRTNQLAIVGYFGLPREIDLSIDALFLYPGPISDQQRRIWLNQRIAKLEPTTLRQLYPALERLLKDP